MPQGAGLGNLLIFALPVLGFSLDGRDYEIDLCAKHSQKFDDVVGRYAEHARRASARAGRTKCRTTAHRQHSAAIRSWAKESGIEVSDRGSIRPMSWPVTRRTTTE